MANDNNKALQDMQESFEALLQSIVGPKFYNDAKKFAVRRPFIFAAILSIGVFSLIPMIIFLAFAITTLFIALICFLCIEGSIIAIGGIIFIGIVSFISVIVGFIMAGVATAYFTLKQIRSLLKSSPFPCMSQAAKNGEGMKADVTVNEAPVKNASSKCDKNMTLDNTLTKSPTENLIRKWLDEVETDNDKYPELGSQLGTNAIEDADNTNEDTSDPIKSCSDKEKESTDSDYSNLDI